MKVYNSYSQQIEDFIPLESNKVKMYVCGPTVYDYPHLGHARCYITWDMVYRYLKFKGYEVTYARNITDVDDKIINKARENNTTPEEIANTYYKEFIKSMQELNVLDADIEPFATKTIGEMIGLVKKLESEGFAYAVDGDVYFRVKRFKKYGNLSKQSIEDLESGARIEASDIKENPLDFALWKAVKSDDEIGWNSPWGKGRPGWHLECSAMIKKHLGETIDIHAGGQDLLFPHHENELAQSECANDKQFVKYWLHNGFVTINAEKMSKSLGNFISIGDLLEKYDANTIRFFILTNHYRMPVGFTDESLDAAKAGFQRLKNAYNDIINVVSKENIEEYLNTVNSLINDIINNKTNDNPMLVDASRLIINFIDAMDDDFNTSKALAVLFDLASSAQIAKNNNDDVQASVYLATLVILSNILGFDITKQEQLDNELAEKLMDIILDIRKEAREQKNWALSDKIRDELKELNITLKDSKEGTSWIIE